MNFILTTGIILNIILIFGIGGGKYFYKKQNITGFIAVYTAILGALVTLYLFSFMLLSVFLLIQKNYFNSMLALSFAAIPFVIGNIASYKKADKFINIQIAELGISLFYLLWLVLC